MRRILKIAFSRMAVVLAFAALDAAAQVTATLAVIPEQTLPAIPVDFRLSLSSASSQPVTLRNGAILEVTTDTGLIFFAQNPSSDTVFVPIDEYVGAKKWLDTVVVQPGTSRDYYWTVGCDLSSEFFLDRRLSKPGRYSLRILLLPEGVFDVASGQAVWSNAVTLTVQQPQGDDAAIWAMLTARAAKDGRDGFSPYEWATLNQFEIAEEIYTKYPRSSYVPYVACFKSAPRDEDRLAPLEAALALNPKGPIADRVKLSIAALHTFLADKARAALDAEGAIAELAAARQIMQEVEVQSIYPFIREAARYGIDHLTSDEHIRKNVAELTISRRNSPYQQVIPFVDCVSIQHDGGLTARFGYKNIKDQTETIEAGPSNAIFPADAARKLPTSFRPGVHKNAVRATTSGGPVTWRLLTFSATATKTSKPCGGNN